MLHQDQEKSEEGDGGAAEEFSSDSYSLEEVHQPRPRMQYVRQHPPGPIKVRICILRQFHAASMKSLFLVGLELPIFVCLYAQTLDPPFDNGREWYKGRRMWCFPNTHRLPLHLNSKDAAFYRGKWNQVRDTTHQVQTGGESRSAGAHL